jgi:plastocyanin
MKRLTLTLGLLALAAVLAACSGASAAPETTQTPATGTAQPATGGTGGTGDTVTVVAKDIAFQTPDVTVKAGAPVTIDFDNQDGAPHNIAISDANGKSVFKGDIVSSTKVAYSVPALAAGTYTFICEVHPNMKGTITAK